MRRALTSLLALAAWIFFASSAYAEPVRILVAAGSALGLAAEQPLKYPENDAARVRDVLVTFGGVKPENALVVRGPTRAQLFASIDRARQEAEKHRIDEVTLVFYFSGHGDHDAIHLGEERVLLRDLASKLGEVPAGLRIAVTDACRATRDKGFTVEEPFSVTVGSGPQATGQVWLHASSDGEAAQESDELQGAIFTHTWLNGLRGAADSNGDARVTLDESFAFAHAQTLLRSAKSSGVLQTPEAIMALHESAPVVLTQPLIHGATLIFPQASNLHFLVYLANARSVISEMWSSRERRIALRVPAGRYLIQKRAGGAASTALVAIAEGESRALEEREFTASTLEPIARKGSDVDASSSSSPDPRNELSLGYDSGWNARMGFVQGPVVAYAYAWPRIALSLGGGADFSSRTLNEKEERLIGIYGRARLEARVEAGAFTLRMGGGGRAGAVLQSIEPPMGWGQSPQHDRGLAMGPELFVAGRIGLGAQRTWFLDVGAVGSLLFLREESKLRGISNITSNGALGARF